MTRPSRSLPCFAAVLLSAVVLSASSSAVLAAELRQVPEKVFEVTFTADDGSERDSFSPGETAVLNMRFTLALSEVSSYPLTVTLTWGGKTTEILNGRADEGVWILTEPLEVPSGSGTALDWKIVCRVKMVNRAVGGADSWYSYYKAEGTLSTRR